MVNARGTCRNRAAVSTSVLSKTGNSAAVPHNRNPASLAVAWEGLDKDTTKETNEENRNRDTIVQEEEEDTEIAEEGENNNVAIHGVGDCQVRLKPMADQGQQGASPSPCHEQKRWKQHIHVKTAGGAAATKQACQHRARLVHDLFVEDSGHAYFGHPRQQAEHNKLAAHERPGYGRRPIGQRPTPRKSANVWMKRIPCQVLLDSQCVRGRGCIMRHPVCVG